MQTFECVQNYVLALGEMREDLINTQLLRRCQDLMRILPTKDFEFNFLADYTMFLNQILGCAHNLCSNVKQLEAFVGAICEGLKNHLLPYLFEIGGSGLEEHLCDSHSPRLFFLN